MKIKAIHKYYLNKNIVIGELLNIGDKSYIKTEKEVKQINLDNYILKRYIN